ncbi:MAG: respiratory chain complex I subunit 1 family protein [Kofleriaceae bacterium]
MSVVANLLALIVMPFLLAGTITRVKARWSGRRGPPIFQLAFDVWRLLHKAPVYSKATTVVFRVGPVVVLATAIASACIVPLAGTSSLVAFSFDFVWFAYVWGLGRVALMLGALDTGSSFEGMGASREATFATMLEPILFLVAGALCLHSGVHTFELALVPRLDAPSAVVMWVAAIAALLVVVQVESSRMPIDDPTTHLELTMVHEVMILDHSSRELALLHLGAAIKLFVGVSVIAMLVNPFAGESSIVAVAAHAGICIAIAIAIGLSEALIARLKLRVVPQYIVIGLGAAAIALLSMVGRGGRG